MKHHFPFYVTFPHNASRNIVIIFIFNSLYYETRRERPKSAPYLRLKNIQGTTIVKIWKKKIFKKIIFEIFFRKKSIF